MTVVDGRLPATDVVPFLTGLEPRGRRASAAPRLLGDSASSATCPTTSSSPILFRLLELLRAATACSPTRRSCCSARWPTGSSPGRARRTTACSSILVAAARRRHRVLLRCRPARSGRRRRSSRRSSGWASARRAVRLRRRRAVRPAGPGALHRSAGRRCANALKAFDPPRGVARLAGCCAGGHRRPAAARDARPRRTADRDGCADRLTRHVRLRRTLRCAIVSPVHFASFPPCFSGPPSDPAGRTARAARRRTRAAAVSATAASCRRRTRVRARGSRSSLSMTASVPRRPCRVEVVPLGGLGEFGMNMLARRRAARRPSSSTPASCSRIPSCSASTSSFRISTCSSSTGAASPRSC